MRLLDARTRGLVSQIRGDTFPYAILSHTWGDDEVTYHDIVHGGAEHRAGYSKLEGACARAMENGLRYVWIDSCCIDQSSNSELSEAINSMFQWYRNAEICFAHLEDVECPISGKPDQDAISKSRWFTRGWTLQELIAPNEVIFVDREWKDIGSRSLLSTIISTSTNISRDVLQEGAGALGDQSVARRMSWAAQRETTRPEDIAYCLLGLFDIHMPLLYGEGAERAFIRLQEEIVKTSSDQSILAWAPCQTTTDRFRGAFATHPIEFKNAFNIVPLPLTRGTHSVVERGLQLRPVTVMRSRSGLLRAVIDCHEQDNFEGALAIPLIKLPGTTDNTLVRHPKYAPEVISRALIESRFSYSDQGITSFRVAWTDSIRNQEIAVLNIFTDSWPMILSAGMDVLFSAGHGVRLYFRLLSVAWSRWLDVQGEAVFIPKIPKIDRLSTDHLQVDYDSNQLRILTAHPKKAWNALSDTFLIREMDPECQSGTIMFVHRRVPIPLEVGFRIDSNGMDAYVHFPDITPDAGDNLGVVSKELTRQVAKTRTRHGQAAARIQKIFIMGRPVWRLVVESNETFVYEDVKRTFVSSLLGVILGYYLDPIPLLISIGPITMMVIFHVVISWFFALGWARKLHEKNMQRRNQTTRKPSNSAVATRLRLVLLILSTPMCATFFTVTLLRYIRAFSSKLLFTFLHYR